MLTNKEQLHQSFWQLVKEQKFKAKNIEGGGGGVLKASGVKSKLLHVVSTDTANYFTC